MTVLVLFSLINELFRWDKPTFFIAKPELRWRPAHLLLSETLRERRSLPQVQLSFFNTRCEIEFGQGVADAIACYHKTYNVEEAIAQITIEQSNQQTSVHNQT